VATVDSATGVVTGVSAGTATITAVRGGLTTSCVVTVTLVFPTAISLPDTALITKGREDTLTVTYTPDFTTETGVTWTSSNPSVAAVDSATGLITAVDVGTATITAASTASTGVTASCVVTVQPVGAGISIEFKGLEDETIILDEPVTGIGWMTLIAPAGFDRYRWYLDGSFYISTTVPGVNLRGGNFTPGNHYLTVIVNEGGYHFSKTLTFTVEGY
jgi:uncharacterized protein YjdB